MAEASPLAKNAPLVADLADGQSIKLIGGGGVGGIVARYAIVYLVHLLEKLKRSGRFVIIDGDQFEAKNRARMMYTEGSKAAVLRDEMLEFVADSSLTIAAIEQFVTPENIRQLLHESDIILLAVDNHATRKLVNDFCDQHLEQFCLISGGNDGIGEQPDGRFLRGTRGNCQVFTRGKLNSPSLSRYHPEIADPADHLPTELDCTEILASQPQNLLANLAAASAILNALWLYLSDSLHYSEVVFDIADAAMRPVPIPTPQRMALRI
jgi:molybdopterin/thiamine biosynthesis adenylyltransferase